jgi:F-type H+-transporting ATPase subunit beta
LLKEASGLERIVSLIGESELSDDKKRIYHRSKILQNYMTQDLHAVEHQTEKKGVTSNLRQTISDVKRILNGEFDARPVEEFLYRASLD